MNPRIREGRAGLALVGLLVLLAFSPAPACPRKPPKEEEAKVTLRPLSASEVMALLLKLPGTLPNGMTEQKNDTGLLKELFPFKEVTSAPLGRVFPGVRFYQGLDRSRSCGADPYMIAISGGKRYWMPSGFDRLLFDKGMKVTDNNIVKLAEALLVASTCSDRGSCPDIVFLSATRTKLVAWATDAVQLKVKIDAQTQEWHFSVLRNQFEGATRVDEKGVLKDYNVIPVESLPKR